MPGRYFPRGAPPMMFVQGGRDAFGTPAELGPVVASLSPAAMLHVVESGDHSFKLSRKNPAAQTAVYAGNSLLGFSIRMTEPR